MEPDIRCNTSKLLLETTVPTIRRLALAWREGASAIGSNELGATARSDSVWRRSCKMASSAPRSQTNTEEISGEVQRRAPPRAAQDFPEMNAMAAVTSTRAASHRWPDLAEVMKRRVQLHLFLRDIARSFRDRRTLGIERRGQAAPAASGSFDLRVERGGRFARNFYLS
ncbi:hypothetical protein PRIC1_010466 [Phytophthora ramorum]